MMDVLHSRTLWIVIAMLLIATALFGVLRAVLSEPEPPITANVTRGSIEEIVSVSGVVESKNAAMLAFATSDIVASVMVDEGDHVEAGAVLAALSLGTLSADRANAAASLSIARADRDELTSGPTNEARDVTQNTVAIATENLERVIIEQDELVKNARRTLYSSGLEARPQNPNEDAVPPTISGTYSCEEPITYELSVYASAASSGYSYHLSGGGETRTSTAHTDTAQPLGSCGLLIRFDADSRYDNSEWSVAVPNTHGTNGASVGGGASYASNLNAYELALKTRTNSIAAATQALELAQSEATFENASPRAEALVRAHAAVVQAEARVAAIGAQIEDRTLRAPFSGTVTDVDILPGEVSGTGNVVTLVSDDVFELTVRIPEIDITKVEPGDTAFVVFDARTSETIESEVEFISPLATEIDGVAYYKGRLAFGEPPTWLRSGLNADVDIIVEQKDDVLRVPRRFVMKESSDSATNAVGSASGGSFVYTYNNGIMTKTPVETGFEGNDGYIEVIGIPENTTVAVPINQDER